MESTKVYSGRANAEVLDSFNAVLAAQGRSRSSVLETFMKSYVEKARSESGQDSLKLSSRLSSYRGIVGKISDEEVAADPRIAHLLKKEEGR